VSGNEPEERVVAPPAVTEPPAADDAPSGESTVPTETAWPAREAAAPISETPAPPAPEPHAEENGTAVVAPVDEAEVAAIEEDEDSDPFAAWPQPQSGAVIEDDPVEGTSVEHVEGEIDVPDGYTVLEGMPVGRRRSVAVVVSRFNGGLTNRMLAKALDALEQAEVASDAITVVPVPGAFELPLAAMALAKTRRYACVVALGAIVRGETPHFDYVASEAASGLQLAAIETGVPVAFGVLTVETVEQGEARIDRAGDAVRTALEMADLFARLRATAH
jgi:6,7-dimethyl-8-ribityllumazine synthase